MGRCRRHQLAPLVPDQLSNRTGQACSTDMAGRSRVRMSALRAGEDVNVEFVAFRVGHDDMFGPWFLDLLENRGAKLPEPGDVAVAVVRAGVQIKVQPGS